jgi:hypothetical protein
MGCNLSKSHTLTHVDDSVHVMLSHEKKVAKKKGMTDVEHNTYVPRAEHPLLANKNHNLNNNTTTTTSDTTNTSTTPSSSSTPPPVQQVQQQHPTTTTVSNTSITATEEG